MSNFTEASPPASAAPTGKAPTNKGNDTGSNNIWSKTMVILAKPYHFDLRENYRGRYLKITEVTDKGRRTILLPSNGIRRLVDVLETAISKDYNESVEGSVDPVLLMSRNFRTQGDKRFYFDVMKGQRGLFLKLVEMQPNNRTVVLIPERGWDEIVEALSGLQTEEPEVPFSASDLSVISLNPQEKRANKRTLSSRRLVVPPKKFYFDLQENDLGKFCKVAEIQNEHRATVIIPIEAWSVFVAQMECLIKEDYTTIVEGSEEISKGENDIEPLASRVISVQNGKQFYLDVRENSRGKFLKLSEVKDARRNTIFVPDAAFPGFKQSLDEFTQTAAEQPGTEDNGDQ